MECLGVYSFRIRTILPEKWGQKSNFHGGRINFYSLRQDIEFTDALHH
jgi:hypothetical protein